MSFEDNHFGTTLQTMNETPKRQKRKVKEDSPSGYFKNDFEGTAITYQFHPNELRMADTPNYTRLGKRPVSFIKSPSFQFCSGRKAVQSLTPTNDKELECEKLFKSILEDNGKDNVESSDDVFDETSNAVSGMVTPDRRQLSKQSKQDIDSCLLDDSCGDALFLLSQQIENEVEKESCKNKNKTPSNRNRQSKYVSDGKTKESNKNSKHQSHLNTNKARNNKHYLQQDSDSSNVQDSSIKSLLEDGNDAGFFDLDETAFVNESLTDSFASKCTPEEIEAKRKLALKKLQEKKMKTMQVNKRFIPQSHVNAGGRS